MFLYQELNPDHYRFHNDEQSLDHLMMVATNGVGSDQCVLLIGLPTVDHRSDLESSDINGLCVSVYEFVCFCHPNG